MIRFLQKIIKKIHHRPSDDTPSHAMPNFSKGSLDSYEQNIQTFHRTFDDSIDIVMRELPPGMITDSKVFVSYIEPLCPVELIDSAFSAISALTTTPSNLRPDEVSGALDIKVLDSMEEASLLLLSGWTIFFIKRSNKTYAVNTYRPPVRGIDRSETESVILGPQESFTESLQTSLSILRRRIKSPHLKVKLQQVGKYSQAFAAIAYLDNLAQKEYVDSVVERMSNIEVDSVFDGGNLAQMLDDNPFSPFPQFHMTERPERITSHLLDGKVAIFLEGSPFGLTGPASFIEFFQTSEDYSNRWVSASVIRTLRIVGVVISISLSALYVAVVTYHYQMIPNDMVVSLTESRARVPFPPLYETLLMEVTIELLREAGARLPTKVGQTIGIVGGIVLGQAAVSAGFASNILIISVALSTIASFITPSYIMSGALRALRFYLILLAGFFGLYGLFIGILMIAIHFLHLSSLGTPYLTPMVPIRLSDWKDTFVRAPSPFMIFRPTNTRPRDTKRQSFQDPATPHAIPTDQSVDSGKGDES
ncbi:spore germination protein [Tumebacillus lipolyticus]|uniref:Spore germination protein n=1 Tax=Tumebacillus lipolyticus TaxID=1280370 RepID=A0ABW4ZW53_9BACL